MKKGYHRMPVNIAAVVALSFLAIAAGADGPPTTPELTEEQVENLVERSYQYVAMYNVNNKLALKQGGWNTIDADTKLKDHTMREIARPNNDTLYDNKNGFFIPNERKKYSVGENAGMKLERDGGIEIHVAAEKPEGVPEENWLPINRGDEGIAQS